MERSQRASAARSWSRALGAGLVAVTIARVWLGPITTPAPAVAQIPDSGAQRLHLIEEARKTNQLLTEIRQILLTHTFKVRAERADNIGTDN